MKIKYWPKTNSIPIEVCSHRYGADMTFSVSTDTRVLTSLYAAQLYGFRQNVRMGTFCSSIISNSNVGIEDESKTGLLRHDLYFPTDYWLNPTTNVIEIIPDYYSTTWTSVGVSAFPETAILGNTKSTRYPNHGQQMYAVTLGRLGYDINNSVSGSSNLSELYGICNHEKNFYFPLINRNISTGSFRNGQSGSAIPNISKYLGIRNSPPSPAGIVGDTNSFYGFSSNGDRLGLPLTANMTRQNWSSFPNTYRWWDSWNTSGNSKIDATNYMISQLEIAKDNEGWYRDFMHWHNAKDNGTITSIEELFSIFRTNLTDIFAWSCSYGEAVEYMYLRSITDRVAAYEKDNKIIVIADIEDSFKNTYTNGILNNLNLDQLNIPISVKIDLTGTYLENKIVKAAFGKIRDLGSNIYILEIPFKNRENIYGNVLLEGENGIFNENIPTGIVNTSGSTLSIECSIPCKAVLFSVATGGNDYDSTIVGYSNSEFKITHNFSITSGKDYRIGIISEFMQTNLIDV